MPSFRPGKLNEEVVESLDIEELYEDVEHGVTKLREVVNDSGEEYTIAETARDPHLIRDEEGNPESLYFRYVVRDREDYESMRDDGHDETRRYEPRDVTDFLVTTQGDIAYESGGSPAGPLGFLFEESNTETMYAAGLPLPQSVLQEDYHDADRVSMVRVSFPNSEPSDRPSRANTLPQGVEQVAAVTETVTHTVGHYHGTRDLREVELINEMVDVGTIDVVSFHKGDNSRKLSEAGWIEFHFPDDLGYQERASIIRRRVAPLFSS